MKIIEAAKLNGMSVADITNILDISATQVYKWNKHGISINNRYYTQLKILFPELTPKDPTLRLDEQEDQRYNAGRQKNKNLSLKEIPDLDTNTEPEFTSTLFPKITIRRKSD